MSGPQALREKFAFNAMAWQHDTDAGDWPADKVQMSLDRLSEEHSGNCIKQPWTCMRCCAEIAYRQADQLMDAVKPILDELEALRARVAKLEGALSLILHCTPGNLNFYDCGDPFEIAHTSLNQGPNHE